MAEIIAKTNNKCGRQGPKPSPRIDLTPMVDLGFLLITFFIFTTSLSEPRNMEIQMPAEGGPPTELAHHTAMTIFLSNHHHLLYYSGMDAMNNQFDKLTETGFNNDGIRNALLNHAANVKKAIASRLKGSSVNDLPFVIIKAGPKSDYGDLVNLLDELMITNTGNYALMDLTMDEAKEIESRAH